MDLLIRRMIRQDLDGVLEIENQSFPVPWSRESFLSELRNPLAMYIVAEEGEAIQAYSGVWIIFDEGHITNVAVHPRARGRGIGEMLLTQIIGALTIQGVLWLTLEVRPSNHAALDLYQRLGFVEVGLRKGYYIDNNEDAIIMTRKLADDQGDGTNLTKDASGKGEL